MSDNVAVSSTLFDAAGSIRLTATSEPTSIGEQSTFVSGTQVPDSAENETALGPVPTTRVNVMSIGADEVPNCTSLQNLATATAPGAPAAPPVSPAAPAVSLAVPPAPAPPAPVPPAPVPPVPAVPPVSTTPAAPASVPPEPAEVVPADEPPAPPVAPPLPPVPPVPVPPLPALPSLAVELHALRDEITTKAISPEPHATVF